MIKHFLILFFSILFVLSCQKNEEQTAKTQTNKPKMSVAISHKAPTVLSPNAQKKITNWKEYKEINDFLGRFKNISPSEALSNALELKDLSKNLKDSIRVELLKTPAFNARLNVFENETLRLADMTYIPAISPKEVNQQIDKILLLFESINAKIDAVVTKENLEKNVNLDNFFKPQENLQKATPKEQKKKLPTIKFDPKLNQKFSQKNSLEIKKQQ